MDASRSTRLGFPRLSSVAVLMLVAAALAAACVALVVAAQEPARASFPGKNGEIAFLRPVDGTYQIFTVSPAGGTPKQLTFDETQKASPAWSSDGRRIAFVRWGPRGSNIYAMKADGSGKVAITSSRRDDYSPAWSPGGRRLVFSRDVGEQPFSNRDLFTVRRDGSHVVRLTRTDEIEDGPAWSPDSNTIAFSRCSSSGDSGIYTMKADGSETPSAVVSPGCDLTFVALGEVDWSPDGQWLAYVQASNHGSTIWKVRADGTEQTFLTSGAGVSPIGTERDAFKPAWSPDGSRIAFSSSSSVYTMDTDGNNVQSIVEGAAFEPSWRPVP